MEKEAGPLDHMKKIIILLVLFAISLFLAVFLVVNENQRRSNATLLNNGNTEKENRINTEFFEGKMPSATATPPGKSAPTPKPTETPAKTSSQVPLFLTTSSPSSSQTVSDANILVKGTTAPQTSVMINEFELTADSQGNFSKSLSLDEGENYINVVVYNNEGEVVEKELIITREVQE